MLESANISRVPGGKLAKLATLKRRTLVRDLCIPTFGDQKHHTRSIVFQIMLIQPRTCLPQVKLLCTEAIKSLKPYNCILVYTSIILIPGFRVHSRACGLIDFRPAGSRFLLNFRSVSLRCSPDGVSRRAEAVLLALVLL